MWPFNKKAVEVEKPPIGVVSTEKYYISASAKNHPFYTVNDPDIVTVSAVKDGWVKYIIKYGDNGSKIHIRYDTEQYFLKYYQECTCLNS